jgi:hypothetical protein
VNQRFAEGNTNGATIGREAVHVRTSAPVAALCPPMLRTRNSKTYHIASWRAPRVNLSEPAADRPRPRNNFLRSARSKAGLRARRGHATIRVFRPPPSQ